MTREQPPGCRHNAGDSCFVVTKDHGSGAGSKLTTRTGRQFITGRSITLVSSFVVEAGQLGEIERQSLHSMQRLASWSSTIAVIHTQRSPPSCAGRANLPWPTGRWSPDEDLYMHAVAVVLHSPRTSTAALKGGLRGDEEMVDDNCCAWFLARMEYDGIVGRRAFICRRSARRDGRRGGRSGHAHRRRPRR
jgi:hypothetical protein